ncbi:MAG TPA: alpha/beta fold hydrolase [Pseudonocardia sp.]|nr:alpha/beta fold hydrolase [Pseudonocardia sp.]
MSTAVRNSDLWFRNFAPAPSAPVRLVCLPHAGGSASFYLPMARGLSPAVDVLCAQYPGRQDRRQEPCRATIGELADDLTEALLPWCDRPLALFGHSMGATVGYEVARRLEVRSEPGAIRPLRLFASGRRAPSVPANDHIHELEDAGILAELTKLSGTMSQILGDEEIMRMALPAIRADYTAAETYIDRADAPLRCPITVLTGDDDVRTTLEAARQWRRHTSGAFDFHVLRGGHFFIAEHMPAVLALIRDGLAEV